MYTKSFIITLLLGLGLSLGPTGPRPAAAQEAKVDSLEARVQELEARIDSLLAALAAGRGDTAAARDELEALRAAAREAAGGAEPDTSEAQGSRTRNLQILNPEISVTGDIVGNFTAPADGEDRFSATPREFEFSFQAALDPYTRTKIFITREEDFEIAGLPLEEEGEEEGGGFEIEEGYMYWVGLPLGFGAKLGKFRQEIGLYNRWHTHALFEVDRPLATAAFLGEDGLIQTGGSILLPSFGAGPSTQTVTVEVTAADNDALFEGGGEISYLGHLQSFWDVSSSSYIQLGGTAVYGPSDSPGLESSRLFAVDLSYRWTPPGRSLYRDLNLKGEWYYLEKDRGAMTEDAHGGYVQANYQLSRRWIVGARVDYLDGPGGGAEVYQVVPSLTWWQSEWARIRLQYNFLKPDGGEANHTVLLQTVWAVGPHKHETY